MTTLVRIRPEHITEHRMRMEMVDLEDEDTENTIRMKGWPWRLARHSWVYAGEPDFIYRQIREVIIGLPDMGFHPESIEESIRTVEAKARNREEHEVGFSHAWVAHPMAAAVTAFMKTLVDEPPIEPGTPDPYESPEPGSIRAEEHLQLGAITQFVTTLVKAHEDAPLPPLLFHNILASSSSP